jgi:hypothetical protein
VVAVAIAPAVVSSADVLPPELLMVTSGPVVVVTVVSDGDVGSMVVPVDDVV